jgi:hypothetical protein
MAILRISSATANNNTVTIGTHAKNDSLLIFAYRDGSATAPTLPAGWYGLHTLGSGGFSGVIGWKRATSAIETSGTWTNATTLHAIVYRPGADKIIVPVFLGANAGSTSASPAVNGQPTGTFPTNQDDFWVGGWVAMRNSSNNLQSATWTGLSNVTSSTDGSTWQVVVNDTNATRTTAWTNQSAPVANSAPWRSVTFGLLEVPTQSAGGGTFNPLQHPLIR